MRSSSRVVIGALLLAAALLPGAARGQVVQGRVTESGSGEPIPDALVTLVGPDNAVVTTARTSREGSFVVGARAEGVHRIRVERAGYRPAASNPLRLSAADTLDVNVSLPLQVVLLDSVQVVSRARRRQAVYLRDFYDRVERNPFGRYFTREDIERVRPMLVTELFNTVAGMRLIPTRTGNVVQLRGCTPTFYVDGTRVHLGGQTIDELVPPGDLEGVEIYKSLAGAPPQAQGMNAGCSAIFFWTRIPPARR